MEHVQQQEQEMKELLSQLETTLHSFKEFLSEVKTLHGRWTERVERINALELGNWRSGNNVLAENDVETLIALRETAKQRVIRDDERIFEAESVLSEMQKRHAELTKASRKFAIYATMNAIEASSEMSNNVGQDVASIMQQSREASFKANAFIEIEAGKHE